MGYTTKTGYFWLSNKDLRGTKPFFFSQMERVTDVHTYIRQYACTPGMGDWFNQPRYLSYKIHDYHDNRTALEAKVHNV
jgi:hypothetical protein